MSDAITAVAVSVPPVLLTIGLDVGDRYSHACVVDSARKVVEEFRLPTDRAGLVKHFSRPPCRIILEVGPHSRWMQKSLEELGHLVRVVDARKVELIAKGTTKTDRRDARTLALLGAGVPELLGDIKHRSAQAQADLSVLLTRDHFVALRTATINRVRGVLKACGCKVPRMSTRAFHARVGTLVPEEMRPALVPLLEELGAIHQRIKKLDETVAKIAQGYPAVERLTRVDGVGTLTALAFALSIDDPRRFKKSRDVGPFVGLCPRKHSSGESDPQLSITRAVVASRICSTMWFVHGSLPCGSDRSEISVTTPKRSRWARCCTTSRSMSASTARAASRSREPIWPGPLRGRAESTSAGLS